MFFFKIWFYLFLNQVSTFYAVWDWSTSLVWWMGVESNFSVHLWSKSIKLRFWLRHKPRLNNNVFFKYKWRRMITMMNKCLRHLTSMGGGRSALGEAVATAPPRRRGALTELAWAPTLS